jgi:hypothetical protein
MSKILSRARLGAGVVLIAGLAVLSGCGPAPYNRTTTSEETTTTTPAAPVTTTTTTTEQNSQQQH